MITAVDIKARLQNLSNPVKAVELQRFFKTGPGEYAEGDRFIGIMVPEQRKVAIEFADVSLPETCKLLKSGIHEHRLVALLILVRKFQKGDDKTKADVYGVYMKHTQYINNWDLVDLSAPRIVGAFLQTRSRSILDQLADSPVLWERRIAVIATFHFIPGREFADSFRIADTLLSDSEDLIHKAAGWMLREIGKRDQAAEESFLKPRYKRMPRTMLRYAIERFPERLRKSYLRGEI